MAKVASQLELCVCGGIFEISFMVVVLVGILCFFQIVIGGYTTKTDVCSLYFNLFFAKNLRWFINKFISTI